ncbi:hypothetical protein Gorai_023965, partial [Gossypium raimondii]|nr:hypothetical protein [Gossypium raimondii]
MLKPIILNAIVDSEIISDEVLDKAFEELGLFVEELREQFESCQPLSGKVYFVLQVEALISRIQNSCLDIFQYLKSSDQHLPDELSSTSLEAMALEKLKENAEQAEKTAEVVFIDQLIALVSHMHHRLVLIKQSHTSSPVLIPADFCCPLSLELMTDLLPDPMKSINLNQSHLLLVHESKSAESGLRKDSNSFLHSRNSQSMSPQSWSPSQSSKNLITFSGLHREATSQIHPRSTSEGSLAGVTEDMSNNHTRSDSTSSSLSNLGFPRGDVGDNSETSE